MTRILVVILWLVAVPAFSLTPTPTPSCPYGATGHTLSPPTSADNGQVNYSGGSYLGQSCTGVDIAATSMSAVNQLVASTFSSAISEDRYITNGVCPKNPGNNWPTTLVAANLRSFVQADASADGGLYDVRYAPETPTPPALDCADYTLNPTGTAANNANRVSALVTGEDNVLQLCQPSAINETGWTKFKRWVSLGSAPAGVNSVAISNNRTAATGSELELCCGCIGDSDRNGFVNSTDFAVLISNFGRAAQPPTGQGDADFNGFVNFQDYAAVQQHFGKPCP